MPQLIDIQELEAAMEEFRIDQRSKADIPGPQGAVARGQLAVLPEATIWRAKEMNRGTDPNEVMNAIVALCASIVLGEATSFGLEEDEIVALVDRVLAGVKGEIGAIIDKQRNMVQRRFNFKEAGNA